MKYTAIAGLATVAIILAVMLATACGERVGTVTPAVSPEPTPSAEQPTALPITSPTEAPIQTPTPRPTRTPAPPTPTPTPTLGELTVPRFGWYTNEETNSANKSHLIGSLLRISEKYPVLFDALIQEPWLNPVDVPETFEPVIDVVNGIESVAEVEDGKTAALKVLSMPFLDSLEGDEVELLDVLGGLTRFGANHLSIFLDHAITKGGLTDRERRVDIYYTYMEAHDPAGMNRLFRGRLPEDSDVDILKEMIDLHGRYPAAYFATSEKFTVPDYAISLVVNVARLAAIDEQLARRMAQMPFNNIPGGLDTEAWVFVEMAAGLNREATETLLEKYEMQGGADHSTLSLLVMDAAHFFAPTVVETLRNFDWVTDGVDGPRIEAEDGGIVAIKSLEERMVGTILWSTRWDSPWIEQLMRRGWIQDSVTSDEYRATQRLPAFTDDVPGMLIGMEFFDEIDGEDTQILFLLRKFQRSVENAPALSLSDVLNDHRISGEITDANRHHVQAVIDDVLENHGLATEDD